VLIVVDTYASDAAASGCSLVTYQGYTIQEQLASAAHLTEALRYVAFKGRFFQAAGATTRAGGAAGPVLVSVATGQRTSQTKKPTPKRRYVVGAPGARAGLVGVEEGSLPVSLWSVLRAALPDGAEALAIDGWLRPLREVKTDEELAKLRENFALTDSGHAAARRAVRAGQREIDVWTALESAIQQAAGQRVPVGNDCVVGYRQDNSGGWPRDLVIRPRDSVIVDLSTVKHGYWSDSCATYYAGEPTRRQREMHRTAADALEFAISLIKPGAIAREIDRAVRQFMADAGYPVYPHHTGHGVGVSGHEEPRIVPYNDRVLEPNMALMLEPGVYYPGETGVRLEDAVVVTATGAEILTHHDKSLP